MSVLDRWLADDRPAPPLIVVVLAICAIAGFVGGGVLASLPASGDGAEQVDASLDDSSGGLVAVDIAGVEASCERESGRDEAGEPVEYRAQFVLDADTQTAWQCRGDGEGETLTFDLGESVSITTIGLIPGYAKVDNTAGTDWYPRNRRLTEVRWHFDEGDPVSHVLDPDPEIRDLQYLELDEPRATSTLTMEIISSEIGDGDRPNIAVSEVAIMQTSG